MALEMNPNVQKQVEQAATEGLGAAARELLAESNRRAPKLDGHLRGSGKAVVKGKQAAVGYDSPYAVKQHEALRFRHPGGGSAKFLELALRLNSEKLQQIIAERVRREIG